MENKIFINLETLNLKGNNLSDIISLTKVKFENLKTLNLSSNQIGDNMIKSFYNFNFPKLEYLDVGINNFQSYDFFKSTEHPNELKQLNIYSNLFKKETLNNLNVKEINLQSLKEVDFSNGVFSEETINFMFSIFKFKNLKKIDLTSNDLRTLNFIQSIYNCPLENLILTNNKIDESQLMGLKNFKNIKEINLANNLIKRIDELENLVNELEKIESFDKIIIYGNKIDLFYNKKIDDDIINEIGDEFDKKFY